MQKRSMSKLNFLIGFKKKNYFWILRSQCVFYVSYNSLETLAVLVQVKE